MRRQITAFRKSDPECQEYDAVLDQISDLRNKTSEFNARNAKYGMKPVIFRTGKRTGKKKSENEEQEAEDNEEQEAQDNEENGDEEQYSSEEQDE